MSAKRLFFIPFSVLVILALVACGAATPAASGGTAGTPGSGSAPSGGGSGACTNPWEPVKAGDSWDYSVTSPTNSGTYVRTIQTVASDGFSDQTVFSNGITRPGQWKCDNGTLTTVDPFSTDSSASSSKLSLHTVSTDGKGLPAGIKPGDTFAITYHMAGTITENGTTSPLTEDISESCKAVDMQPVTVAAGSFTTLHLTCQLGLTMTMTIAGATTPIVSNSTAERYYAKGVGLVKSTDTSSAGVRETDLTAYTVK